MTTKARFFSLLALVAITLSACCEPCDSAASHDPNDTLANSTAALTDFPEKLTIPSADELPITAELYHHSTEAPVIVLCHQAGWNKFEYHKIAPKLHEMGYNCLAIDQRSGGPMVEAENETVLAAMEAGKSTKMMDAEPDLVAAVDWAAERYGKKVILWGSSYSSTLALYIGMQNDNVLATLSFSPGDYWADEKGSLKEKLQGYEKPFFVTSSLDEADDLRDMMTMAEMNDKQVRFKPDQEGRHGSRALWMTHPGNGEYWDAVKQFLGSL